MTTMNCDLYSQVYKMNSTQTDRQPQFKGLHTVIHIGLRAKCMWHLNSFVLIWTLHSFLFTQNLHFF